MEEAFKANNAARREYNAKVLAARKAYNEAVAAAKKAFDAAVSDASNAKDAAEKHYDKMLKEFTEKHAEGYHLTLRDGDNVMTISSDVVILYVFCLLGLYVLYTLLYIRHGVRQTGLSPAG